MRFAVLTIAAVFMFVPFMAQATGPDMKKYPDSLWAESLLNVIEDGPHLFSREDQYQLPAFPENDSEETKEELDYLHTLIPERDKAGVMGKIIYENSGVLVRDVFIKEGLLLIKDNYKTQEIMDLVDKDLRYFVLESKKSFARPRPSHLDSSLTTSIENPEHASYPSGHAAQSHMVALILSDFDPENAKAYKRLAKEVAHRREIAGVHFPSDTKAGMEMAEHFYKKFRSIPAFEKKYQDAKLTYIKPNLQKEED